MCVIRFNAGCNARENERAFYKPKMRLSLTAQRAALYRFTRPAYGVAAVGVCMAIGPEELPALSTSRGVADAVSLLPLAATGVLGAASAWRGRHGYRWLAHGYEQLGWTAAFGGLAVAAAVQGASALTLDAAAAAPEREPPPLLLGASAACALAVTVGERLGSGLGRVLTPTLGALGVASCAACVLMGDRRGELALQCWAALLLPALHLCLPVYTLSAEATLSCCWFLVALGSAASSFEAPDESGFSTAAIQNLLLACGAASLHRTLMKRAPICQY